VKHHDNPPIIFVDFELWTSSVSVAMRLDVCHFYRAMHFSAKRGIAIACRLSVRLYVCDVDEL